jgi:hypothetical protein
VDDRFGGSATWLQDNGLDAADLDRLRRRLAGAFASSATHPFLSARRASSRRASS